MPNVSFIDGHIDEVKETNYDRIKKMSVEEMAKEFIRARMQLDEDGFDYDITYSTSDRRVFIDYKDALKHQKQWLLQEVTNDER